jgi:signal transduction histidine kinase
VKSLRSRLVVGALLWTVGMLAVMHVVVAALSHFTGGGIVRLGAWWSVVAIGLLAAGLAQVKTGLAPLGQLRSRLLAVREGGSGRVGGSYPTEVQPLVDDLNALLEDRERAVSRAQAQASDLAHGLKTPLAVLAQEAERARAAGHGELATTLEHQLERMTRQVDYHLAHARAAASGARLGARSVVGVSVAGLVRTLQRLHAERRLVIDAEVPEGLAVPVEREDLDEMLGNLLDNACKWARSRVRLAASAEGPGVLVTVVDDGPGLDPSLHDRVLQRGVRADEAAPGTGLGLAIVRDLAELYGGGVRLDRSPEGGVRASLRLPSA